MAIAGVELRHARQADDRAAQVLAIAGDPAAHRATGALARGGSVTVIVAGARAALVTTDMPGLADDRIYQLWLVRPGQVQSAGLGPGGGAAAGRWSRLITGVSAGDEVAISVEPSGGSRQPTTTPLALLSA
jgi:anti-sigma-K factor RskA